MSAELLDYGVVVLVCHGLVVIPDKHQYVYTYIGNIKIVHDEKYNANLNRLADFSYASTAEYVDTYICALYMVSIGY